MKLMLEGYIDFSCDDDIVLKKSREMYSNFVSITEAIEEAFSDVLDCNVENRGTTEETKELVLDNARVMVFASDEYESLEDCVNKMVLASEGLLDIKYETFAYSEFTIIGLELSKMQLGGHDLCSLFESKRGMYAHVIIADEEIRIEDMLKGDE